MLRLEAAMREGWSFGANLFLLWARSAAGIDLLRIPHRNLVGFLAEQPAWIDWPEADGRSVRRIPAEGFLALALGPDRMTTPRGLEVARELLHGDIVRVRLPATVDPVAAERGKIDLLIRRYGMNFQSGRAVFLLDIVDFSLFHPLEQVTQIHSLATSLNVAHQCLLHREIDVRFARSSTGDGFYVWNRDQGPRANLNLYHLMHLTLAENALGRRAGPPGAVPRLKAAFHLGSYFDLYPAEDLRPAADSMIVGNLTVELARVLDAATPGQILIGDFEEIVTPTGTQGRRLNTPGFIEMLQHTLVELTGLPVGDRQLASLRCYLTGDRQPDGRFDIVRYRVSDKHQRTRVVFNAKVNIETRDGDPVYLGLQNHEVLLPRVGESSEPPERSSVRLSVQERTS